MRIPILDLKPEIEAHWNEFSEAMQQVARSTHFILGPNVREFEKEIAAYLGVKYAIGCNSGTDALVIGLRALNVGPGDEVITTPFTFFATAEAVSMVGATPVFVDIDPDSYNLNIEQVAARITPKTKAVIPVHLYGNAVKMDELLAVTAKHGIRVLEDVAQAMGGEYQGRKLGAFGDIGAFSFFPSKNLGGFGDGGLMTTNDDKLAEQCRMLRVHGSLKKYYNEIIGYNSRLDEMQAAVLRVKLKYLDESNEGRRKVAARYAEVFRGSDVLTPTEVEGAKHVFHQYTVRVPAAKRDLVAEKLAEKGIGTMIYYPVPLHRLTVYKAMPHQPLPHTDKASEEVISLPIWPTLSTEAQLEVAAAVKSVLEGA